MWWDIEIVELHFQRLVKDAGDAGDTTEEEAKKKKKRSKSAKKKKA